MDENEKWTLMFYFASDNPLAPGIVSQLKALKNAGYHPDVNVIAYFDPQPFGTPAHIFDVNGFEKLGKSKPKIGFRANDPYVRNLMFDKLWGNETGRDGKLISKMIESLAKKQNIEYTLPSLPPKKIDAAAFKDAEAPNTDPGLSLEAFLDFCAGTPKYQADHYMLFILGHGLVVGDDVFLYDEHTSDKTLTLRNLGTALKKFKIQVEDKFELISFHSCSMSSLEAALELQDTANYMLASQGSAFVASWPYTQILIRIFNDVRKDKLKTSEEIKLMVKKIFGLVYHNSTDFLLAGYPFDLCLCDLRAEKMAPVAQSIKDLSGALRAGLVKGTPYDSNREMATICILLAHWKSQSYWNDTYTDLYDFCWCLQEYCQKFIGVISDASLIKDIYEKCGEVIRTLKPYTSKLRPDNPVVRAEFAGPQAQYSHGLSVFFPWTQPTSDRTIMKEDMGYKGEDGKYKKEYELYEFNQQTEWFNFLSEYWGQADPRKPVSGTMRPSITEEKAIPKEGEDDNKEKSNVQREYNKLVEDIASIMFNADGAPNTYGALSDKKNPPDPTGDECTCGSIKNYRRDTRAQIDRSKSVEQGIPISQKNSRALKPLDPDV